MDNIDREKAQFILQSFRPDGEDANDATFKEALHLAARDRELGEWLANERATDAAFARALMEVEIPDDLRLQILAVMHGEKPNDPEAEQAMDEFLQTALDDVEPPAGLRDQIIAAMNVQKAEAQPIREVTQEVAETATKKTWPKMSGIMAMAAALLLGAILALNITPQKGGGETASLSSYDVQRHAAGIVNASFELDVKKTDQGELNNWLVSHQLPTPTSLPAGLSDMKRIGCKQIALPGEKNASLICFLEDSGGVIHVIVVKNSAISDEDLPALSNVNAESCYHCPKTGWDVARWHDAENSYIMLAKGDSTDKKSMLRYF